MASQGKRMVPEYLIKALENLFNSDLAVKITVGSIDHITSEDLSSLECGDIVCKEDATGKHSYIVSYKSEEGICLTYTDASVVETVSYDYTGGEWVYNSTDITPIAEPLMENIVDSAGNKRFIEGDITTNTVSGITFSYNKWSLSGSHLMLVIAGTVENGTDLPFTVLANNINIPQYIKDKIIPLFGTDIVSRATLTLYADNATTQTTTISLYKRSSGNIDISISALTLTATRNFRIQFDLLIDNN